MHARARPIAVVPPTRYHPYRRTYEWVNNHQVDLDADEESGEVDPFPPAPWRTIPAPSLLPAWEAEMNVPSEGEGMSVEQEN